MISAFAQESGKQLPFDKLRKVKEDLKSRGIILDKINFLEKKNKR